jgi:Na+-transporting NADH:ubiquinone oxidoreductase subunit B
MMLPRYHAFSGLAGVTIAQTLALVPPAVVVALEKPDAYLQQIATIWITAFICEAAFGYVRRRGISFHGITTGLIVAILVPASVPAWQLALVVALGVILGELIFGGRGFGFLNPATVALSFLVISFPQVPFAAPSQSLAVATLPGAALLLVLGLISWRIVLMAALSVMAFVALKGQPIDPVVIGAALTFGLVFLICDPFAASATNAGRWIYGSLAGGLIVLFSDGESFTIQAVVFASLLTSIFAPLIDHLVVLAHAMRRKARYV